MKQESILKNRSSLKEATNIKNNKRIIILPSNTATNKQSDESKYSKAKSSKNVISLENYGRKSMQPIKSTNMLPKMNLNIINNARDIKPKSTSPRKNQPKKATDGHIENSCFLEMFNTISKLANDFIERSKEFSYETSELKRIKVISSIIESIDQINYNSGLFKEKVSEETEKSKSEYLTRDTTANTSSIVIVEERNSINLSNSRVFKYKQLFDLINKEFNAFSNLFMNYCEEQVDESFDSPLSSVRTVSYNNKSNNDQLSKPDNIRNKINLNFNLNLTEIYQKQKNKESLSFQGILPDSIISFNIEKSPTHRPLFKTVISQDNYKSSLSNSIEEYEENEENSNSSDNSDSELGFFKDRHDSINNLPYNKTKKTLTTHIKEKNTAKVIFDRFLSDRTPQTKDASRFTKSKKRISIKKFQTEVNTSEDKDSLLIKIRKGSEPNKLKFYPKEIPTMKSSFYNGYK